jgi:hypothetical protein
MSSFDTIPIEQVRIYDPWTEAPVGSILRMVAFRGSDAAVLGLRCTLPLLDKQFACFLPLEGHRFGTVLLPEQLAPAAAIDLTALAELAVTDAVPRPVDEFVCGGVYETAPSGSGRSILSIYAEFLDSSAGGAFVRLAPGEGGHRGAVATGAARLSLGAVVIRWQQPSTP